MVPVLHLCLHRRQVYILPTWAHEPTVAQVSTMVPWSTYAPMFDIAGHKHYPWCYVTAVAHCCRRYYPGASRREVLFTITPELKRHLVIVAGMATGDDLVRVKAE